MLCCLVWNLEQVWGMGPTALHVDEPKYYLVFGLLIRWGTWIIHEELLAVSVGAVAGHREPFISLASVCLRCLIEVYCSIAILWCFLFWDHSSTLFSVRLSVIVVARTWLLYAFTELSIGRPTAFCESDKKHVFRGPCCCCLQTQRVKEWRCLSALCFHMDIHTYNTSLHM